MVGAAPKENVVREKPEAGDVIILLGGKTGRDGVGGATGSSKVQTTIGTLITTKNSRHIHQGLRFFATSQLITHGDIFVISRLQLFLEFRS